MTPSLKTAGGLNGGHIWLHFEENGPDRATLKTNDNLDSWIRSLAVFLTNPNGKILLFSL